MTTIKECMCRVEKTLAIRYGIKYLFITKIAFNLCTDSCYNGNLRLKNYTVDLA